MRILYFFLAITLFAACKQKSIPTKVDDSGLQYFGEAITPDGAISLDQMLVKMQTMDSIETKVTGKIASVCKVKGCWMNLTSPTTDNKQEVFVKFKDYGFFMPLESEGQEVIMRGKAYREVTSVDELRHYAEDEGKSAEDIAAITEPVEELKFMADGVILKPLK